MRTLEDRLTQASDEARLRVNGIDEQSATSIRTRQQHRRAFVGTLAIAAMFIIFGASALVISRDAGRDVASEPSTPSTTTAPVDSPETKTPAAVSAATMTDITHLVTSITASSGLSTEFGADRLIDGDLERSWQDASLRGNGAWFEIQFNDPVAIEEIVITPPSEEAGFARNFKVDRYTIEVNDLTTLVTGRMANDPGAQAIAINSTSTMYLRFTVNTTYPALAVGDTPPFDELAIAEIQVFGTPTETPKLPRLGVVSDGWSAIQAIDMVTRTTLIYEGNPQVLGGKAGEPRLIIEIWSDEPNEENGSAYRDALASVIANAGSLGDVTFSDGRTAKSTVFTDPSTGRPEYYFLWQHSDTVAVQVIAYVDLFDQAKSVVSSIEELSESSWDAMLTLRPQVAPVTTTTK